MCKNIRTVQRYLCGHSEEDVDLDLCEDYEQLGECDAPPETWVNKEPINFGSKRVKSKCVECKAEEKRKAEQENKSKEAAKANTKGAAESSATDAQYSPY